MDEYIKRMTDKFLCWKLPRGFSPDAGISFHPGSETTYSKPYWPTGTNLFTADQARAMFEHCADTLIEDLARKDADLHSQGRTLLDVQAQLAAAQAEDERMRKLADFGLSCLKESRKFLGDLDGGWLQDEAVRCGVLVEVEVTKPCGENCECAETVGDWPTTCYRYSDDICAAVAKQEN